MAIINLISFGYGHAPAPDAHLTFDLRHHFRNPHLNPSLRHLTADDAPVQEAVLATPGITDLIHAASAAVAAFANGPTAGPVTLAVGCTGGRHRAPHFTRTLLHRLISDGHNVSIHHRDADKPVINR